MAAGRSTNEYTAVLCYVGKACLLRNQALRSCHLPPPLSLQPAQPGPSLPRQAAPAGTNGHSMWIFRVLFGRPIVAGLQFFPSLVHAHFQRIDPPDERELTCRPVL